MSTDYERFRDLNRQAVDACIDIVLKTQPTDLERPTPCAEWNLGDLLAHMTVQHRGFAAAMEGDARTVDAWHPQPLAPDPAADYASAARLALTAFAAPGADQRMVLLPEISAENPFPAVFAVGFHFLDAVVHAWDVARALGMSYDPSPELLFPALDIARMVPGGDYRLGPGATFGPELPEPDAGSPTFEHILRMLGRSPSWAA